MTSAIRGFNGLDKAGFSSVIKNESVYEKINVIDILSPFSPTARLLQKGPVLLGDHINQSQGPI